ncbi:hypothetical protein DPMN_109545 [Dreissena polymorpha]|uniref:Uncharacterized protein n=1 Tax=Dreissena polymorpha TaxID=45954 RepID=A0A9D4QN40_DREPO|nr:hypothetical protein DPMN_109545 [Dreissena polymorpha]
MNGLTKFHEEVLTRINSPPPSAKTICHVNQLTTAILELIHIIGTNLLTKFLKDRTINVASRVLTRTHSMTAIKNVLPKFHTDWTINVSFSFNKKNAPPPGGHIF